MTKQKPSQRKALRSAAAKKGSLRRKTPPHPSPVQVQPVIGKLADALKQLHDDCAEYQAINHLGGYNNHVMRAAREALAEAGVYTGPVNRFEINPPYPVMLVKQTLGAERALASEPVQPPPTYWQRVKAWLGI